MASQSENSNDQKGNTATGSGENSKNILICDQCGIADANLQFSDTSLAQLVNIEKTDGSKSESQAAKVRRLNSVPPENVNQNCLLLEDTTLECAPVQLRQLLDNLEMHDYSQAEILFMLIYIVSVETGFCTRKQCAACFDEIVQIPASMLFHSKNVINLTRIMPKYINDSNENFMLHLRTIVDIKPEKSTMLYSFLTCYVTGDFMIVTLTPHRDLMEPGSSICLSIGRYVLNQNAKGKPLYQQLRKLKELSCELREKIFLPIRNRQLALMNVHIYPSLLGLPVELYQLIYKHLTQNQLRILANVSKFFSTELKDSKLMKTTKKTRPSRPRHWTQLFN